MRHELYNRRRAAKHLRSATVSPHCAGPVEGLSRTMPPTKRPFASQSRVIILGTSIVLGLAGLAMIFAPAELATALGFVDPRSMSLALQLYGAALMGLAMTGWMVKDSIVGGIFGRSYVVGNATHGFIGAMALGRPALEAGASPVLRGLATAYWVLAIVFGYLMFIASPRS